MTLSVIVVNYNGKDWLEACLKSVFDQALPDDLALQVILVDNASNDGSADFVNEMFPAVSIHEMGGNLGFASGCDFGVSQSSGEFVVFLNNDTVLPKGTLWGLVDDLLQRGLDVVAAIEVPYAGGDPKLTRTTIDILGYPVHLFRGERFSSGDSFFLSAVCLLVRRSTYLNSGGLDTSFFMYFEDIDWFWRLQMLGYRFDYSRTCTVRHAGHGSTGGHEFNYQRFLWRNVNQPRMLLKNLTFANLLWIMPLYVIGHFLECGVMYLVGRRDLAKSYLAAVGPFSRDLRTVLAHRRKIQRERTVGDSAIFAKMYPGSAKLLSLRRKFSRV